MTDLTTASLRQTWEDLNFWWCSNVVFRCCTCSSAVYFCVHWFSSMVMRDIARFIGSLPKKFKLVFLGFFLRHSWLGCGFCLRKCYVFFYLIGLLFSVKIPLNFNALALFNMFEALYFSILVYICNFVDMSFSQILRLLFCICICRCKFWNNLKCLQTKQLSNVSECLHFIRLY